MIRTLKPSTKAFLFTLLLTGLVWFLRGIGVLTFIPGGVLWLLILLSIATAVLSVVR